MSLPVLAALAVGILLYLASACAALLRLGGPLLRGRLLILAVLLVALGLVGAVSPAPFAVFGVAAAGLLAVVVVEALAPPEGRDPHGRDAS